MADTAHKRVGLLRRQLAAAAAVPKPKLLSDGEVQEFIKSGFITLPGPTLGLPAEVHARIDDAGQKFLQAEKADAEAGGKGGMNADNLNAAVPEIRTVVKSPRVDGALRSLLGDGYALHPHTFLHTTFTNRDQDYHKDGALPWNGHAFRHHRPEWILLLYYPKGSLPVLLLLAHPTRLLPRLPRLL